MHNCTLGDARHEFLSRLMKVVLLRHWLGKLSESQAAGHGLAGQQNTHTQSNDIPSRVKGVNGILRQENLQPLLMAPSHTPKHGLLALLQTV